MRIFFFVVLFIVCPLFSWSQYFFTHFDKDFYVPGENAWYKTYVLNAQDTSKVLHINWMDESGRIVESQLLKIENGASNGDFKIPEDLKAGIYTFRAFTLWSLNFGEDNTYKKAIPIFNDIEHQIVDHHYVAPAEQANERFNDLTISVQTNQSKYNKREEVELSISVTDQQGNPVEGDFSISVFDKNLIPELSNQSISALRFQTPPTLSSISYPVENKIRFSGILTDLKSKDALIKNGLLSIFLIEDQEGVLCGLKDGKFSAELPDFYGKREIQIIDIQPKFPHFFRGAELDRPGFKTNQAWNKTAAKDLVNDYLAASTERRFIQNTFSIEKQNLAFDSTEYMVNFNPTNTYFVKNYVAFPKFTDFLDEVVLPIKIKKKSGTRILRMISEKDKKFYAEPAMIMIDNKVTYDTEAFLNLDINSVVRVDLLRNKESLKEEFGILGRYGVIAVQTKKPKKTENSQFVSGFYKARNFEPVIPSDNNVPDFRPILYWNPSIQTNAAGKAVVRFNTSDDISTYSIKIEGVGNQLTGSSLETIEVVEER